MAARARRNLAGVILKGRPPCLPRARADANPAFVRSAISSRSNSANAAKMPNTSLPAAVVVSMVTPWPVSTLRPMPRPVNVSAVALIQQPRHPTGETHAARPVQLDAAPLGEHRQQRHRWRGIQVIDPAVTEIVFQQVAHLHLIASGDTMKPR